jgi:SAM-dependent methyltransferase
MAHPAQQEFCDRIAARLPEYFTGKALDIGALDINGNNRYLFSGEYIGLDLGEGNNVDVISRGHEYNAPDETFDCIISTECFEHDMFYEKTIQNAMRMLKKGGMLIFTCATTGRPVHGTTDTHAWTSPFTSKDEQWKDYYKNLAEEDFMAIPGFEWSHSEFEVNEGACDIYFMGIK